MTLRLLRGRVMIAPEDEVLSTIIATPKPARDNRNSLGIGVVRMMGPPALTPLRWHPAVECRCMGRIGGPQECEHMAHWAGGVEIPPQFKVGSTVRFIGQHVSRQILWEGALVHMVAQEEVVAVIDAHEEVCGGAA